MWRRWSGWRRPCSNPAPPTCATAARRLFLLDRPWAQPWDYATAELDAATARLERLYQAAGRGGLAAGASHAAAAAAIIAALRDDLDVPTALAIAEDAGGAAARS